MICVLCFRGEVPSEILFGRSVVAYHYIPEPHPHQPKGYILGRGRVSLSQYVHVSSEPAEICSEVAFFVRLSLPRPEVPA